MDQYIVAGAGFLLAVLWFDLMFDVQAARQPPGELPEDVLASIAAYYRRVTTAARPMNRLVGVVMMLTLTAIVVQLARGDGPSWVPWASIALAGSPVLLALTHTFPNAVRLGRRADPIERQSRLARSILHDHLFCLVGIAALLVVQLAFGE